MHTGSPGCNDWFSPRGGPALWRTPGVPVAAAATGRHNKLALSLTICSQLDLQGEAAELCVAPCCCVCPTASITYVNMRNVLKTCLWMKWVNEVVRIVSSQTLLHMAPHQKQSVSALITASVPQGCFSRDVMYSFIQRLQ